MAERLLTERNAGVKTHDVLAMVFALPCNAIEMVTGRAALRRLNCQRVLSQQYMMHVSFIMNPANKEQTCATFVASCKNAVARGVGQFK